MNDRKASIKETGEELSPEEWARFEAAVQKDRPQLPGKPVDCADAKGRAKPKPPESEGPA